MRAAMFGLFGLIALAGCAGAAPADADGYVLEDATYEPDRRPGQSYAAGGGGGGDAMIAAGAALMGGASAPRPAPVNCISQPFAGTVRTTCY